MKNIVIAIILISSATDALSQTQPQLSQPAENEFRIADASMSKAWNKTYAGMKQRDAEDKSRGGGFGFASATLESQRAWLSFRDRQCVVEGGKFAGDSTQSAVQTQCRTRMTLERTKQLESLQWR